jgi:ATP-binding cassette, subfamily B, bacterial
MKRFPVYRQLDKMDCGPTCLRMIAQYHGRHYSLEYLRQLCAVRMDGVSLHGIYEAAEKIGFRASGVRVSFDQLNDEIPLPCILHWDQQHFVVLPPQDYSGKEGEKIMVIDPAYGTRKLDKKVFLGSWISTAENEGIVLVLEPTPAFYAAGGQERHNPGFRFLAQYLRPYKKNIFLLILGMLLGSLISLALPFLTQSLVDRGIGHRDVNFITVVLLSQLALFTGSMALDLVRSWILLHMNTRISVSIISDFLMRLMKLPIRFFDSKSIGDITQRIYDHDRIERFLANNTLNTLFSFISLLAFSVVLYIYNVKLLLVFLVGSLLSVVWIWLFMKKRIQLDYERFRQLSENQNHLYELITGMQEVKLNSAEMYKRKQWEEIQARLFKVTTRSLALGQYQQTGNLFFNQLKNIIISYLSAREVINGHMTLGMMLSVSYIIGQMNSPIEQLLEFIRSAQDARVSLERLAEIATWQAEEEKMMPVTGEACSTSYAPVPAGGDIVLQHVSFRYGGSDSPFVLKDVSFTIQEGKVTAIVGTSGSGKTTLMKMLLKFYEPVQGRISIGAVDLAALSPAQWRNQFGVVMQEGVIFSDSIAQNIALGQEVIDEKKMHEAVRISNIGQFINELPLGYTTKIGSSGNGISTGQKQRLLIARSVYKNPRFLYFDEATSALDANNERTIMAHLNEYFRGRTVVIVAHRLSTVKNADRIIVLEHGKIVEEGDHLSLLKKKGKYFELVRNQLELGE